MFGNSISAAKDVRLVILERQQVNNVLRRRCTCSPRRSCSYQCRNNCKDPFRMLVAWDWLWMLEGLGIGDETGQSSGIRLVMGRDGDGSEQPSTGGILILEGLCPAVSEARLHLRAFRVFKPINQQSRDISACFWRIKWKLNMLSERRSQSVASEGAGIRGPEGLVNGLEAATCSPH